MERPTCSTCPCFEDDQCHLNPMRLHWKPIPFKQSWIGEPLHVDANGDPIIGEFIAMHDPAREDGWCASHPEFAEWVESVNKAEVKRPCKVEGCGRETRLTNFCKNSATFEDRAQRICPMGHNNGWETVAQIGPAV